MSTSVKEIVVNTQLEDTIGSAGLTSLREAITEANQSDADKVYINFRKIGDSKSKSWHIKPATPLPALLHKNLYINHSYPKNVTIDGSNLPSGDGKTRTYSLLTIGKYDNILSSSTDRPHLHLRHVNFVNNDIQGGNGSGGGGGGLAAGAGISVLHGDLTLENVVFQNLQAKGGEGGGGNQGGIGHRMQGVHNLDIGTASTREFGPEPGSSGGSGGLPTLLGANTASRGGRGGAKGKPYYSNPSGKHGSSGQEGMFGVGGAGGGSGGGGWRVQGEKEGWDKINIFKSRPVKHGSGGDGGQGGKGGFGAGGGGGGAGGENAFSKGSPQPGGPGGLGGSPHQNNAGKGGGKSRNDYEFTNGISSEMTTASAGTGGTGAALGAALAILNPHSRVLLERINFVGNNANSSAGAYNNIYSINAEEREGLIQGSSLLTYDNHNGKGKEEIKLGKLIDDKDHYAKISAKTPSIESNYRHEATSFNRDDQVALIRDSFVKHTPGHPDITTIRIEQPGSTLRSINVDSSALERSIHDVYQRLLPVENENTIKNRFQSRIIDSFISAATSGFASYSNAGNFFKASRNQFSKDAQANVINKGAATAGGQFLFSIWESHSAYQKDLQTNKDNIEELKQLQAIDRQVTADPIDIKQDRTIVKINNFTIGEDKIYVDDYWPEISGSTSDQDIKITHGSAWKSGDSLDSFEIHLKDSSNGAKKIAEVTLDPESTRILNSDSVKFTPVGYIQALTKKNSEAKRWEIGTILTNQNKIYQLSRDYTGGPAGELRIINRKETDDLTKEWATTTFNHNDIIIGSNGVDHIVTNGGNDLIRPKYGLDTVNGGTSIDWVSLEEINEPIQAIAKISKNKLRQKISTINVTNGTSIISVGNKAFSNQSGKFNQDEADLNNSLIIYDDTKDTKKDITSPTISIAVGSASPKGNGDKVIAFNLSEPSTDFSLADVTISGGDLSNFSGSGSSYTATWTPFQDSEGMISVNNYAFSDSEGNLNQDELDVDNTLILSEEPASANTKVPTISISSDVTSLSSGGSTNITFTLSESSTNFTASDVNISGGSLTNFTGSGTTYTATFTSDIKAKGLNSILENVEVLSAFGPSFIDLTHAGAPNKHEAYEGKILTDEERKQALMEFKLDGGASAYGLYISENQKQQLLQKPSFSEIIQKAPHEILKVRSVFGDPMNDFGSNVKSVRHYRPETITITINQDTSEEPINFLDDKMSAAEAYQLLNHKELSSDIVNGYLDNVEIWDKRSPLSEPRLIAKYNAVSNQKKQDYPTIHSLSVPQNIQAEIQRLQRGPSINKNLKGFYAIRSGSGSNIQGSRFDDHIIISMMDDENESGYNQSKEYADQSKNLRIYEKPTIINGNGGSNKLVFAFDEAQDLEIIDASFISEWQGFRAVVSNNTIIALTRGIEDENIRTIDNSSNKNTSSITINNGEINYAFDPTPIKPSTPLKDPEPEPDPEPSSNTWSPQCTWNTCDDDGQLILPCRWGICEDQLFDEEPDSPVPQAGHGTNAITAPGPWQPFPSEPEAVKSSNKTGLTYHYQFAGKPGKDKLTGTMKNDYLDGKSGDDHLVGRAGDDTFFGRGGDDVLAGNAGDDIFFGGKGRNLIKPGRGKDKIVIHPQGIQVIQRFNPRNDMLIFPKNWKSRHLQFSEESILYKENVVTEFI